MINGTADLDRALVSLEHVLNIVQEEKWSIDYAHANAPLTGRLLFDKMNMVEILNFSSVLKTSSAESVENIDKIFAILKMMTEILEHYSKLAEIGSAWKEIIENKKEELKYYQ
jgi:hypothetical protein